MQPKKLMARAHIFLNPFFQQRIFFSSISQEALIILQGAIKQQQQQQQKHFQEAICMSELAILPDPCNYDTPILPSGFVRTCVSLWEGKWLHRQNCNF